MIKLVKHDDDQLRRARPNIRQTASQEAKTTVTVTERALDALAILRTAEHPMPRQALGLVVGPGGSVILVLDSPTDHDCVFMRDETPIFFVATEVVTRFRGRVLDRDGSVGKGKFILTENESEAVVHVLRQA
jgi:hypothetical protein